jgi:hypothetical protein
VEQLINVLAIDHPDWTIPWAGLGALLLGIGGTLSGIAAIMTARRKGRDEATTATSVSRTGDDGGSGVSSGISDESSSGGFDKDSDS